MIRKQRRMFQVERKPEKRGTFAFVMNKPKKKKVLEESGRREYT